MRLITLLVVLIVLAVTVGPLAVIWALNTLFGFAIAFTFKTWAAALILSALVGGGGGSRVSR